ncbi:MAG: DNA polymerase I [Pirellulales bacterium]|nr:DNA polymerase I [Pirellulales bacterium]
MEAGSPPAARPRPAAAVEALSVCTTASPPPDTLRDKTVYVVDTHSLVHQVFHALPEMTSPAGQPVQAVYGFVRDLFALLEKRKPDYLFCAVDLPGGTFRHAMYDQYKIHRAEMPEDLVPQFPLIYRALAALGIPALGLARFEADDVMATMARLVDQREGQCFVVTSDKDCRQLITDRVKLYNIRRDEVFDAEALAAAWGIRPEQVVDFQALVGDSVDNVPGIPLIGPKAAQELLARYGTLDAVFDHAGEVSGAKRRQNLLEGRASALLSRELVRLKDDVDVPIDWRGGQVGQADRQTVLALFDELGFRSLRTQFETLANKLFGDKLTGDSPDFHPGDCPHFRSTKMGLSPSEPLSGPTYHLVDAPDKFAAFLDQLREQKCVSLDTETTHLWPRWAKIVGCSFAWNDDEAWYLPVRGPRGEPRLEPEATLAALRPVLEDPHVEKIGQNLKYDMIVLRAAGIRLAGAAFDTMVASYLLDAGERNHNLDDLAQRYLNHTTIKITELIGRGKDQKRMDEVSIAAVCDYAAEDALLPWRLRPILARRLAEEGLERLFTEVEMPLVDVLVELEFNGITVDRRRLAELSERYGRRVEALEAEIHELAGRPLNIASPKQLQEILFKELKLPVVKKTKTGPSTDADVLAELAPLHPLPAKIGEYRQYAKLKSTYVDALPEMIFPETGRVHASFNQVVTATGRLSSSDPNLQNIPVRTAEGRDIRSAFVPGEPGWLLLAVDYSQIELRVLAHFSGDEQLRAAFARDEDIHARVAAEVHHVPLEEVTPAMRREAKAVNFGVVYGQSPFGLARQLGIEKDAAAAFIDAYFERYPGIEGFLRRVLAECRQTGYVSTILGRRRAIRGVRADAGRQRNLAERTAVNTVIQGSAADLIKQAMIAIHARLAREDAPARILLQIHDELIFEVPPEGQSPLGRLVAEEMAGVEPLSVPLKVDVKVGPNWADAEAVS